MQHLSPVREIRQDILTQAFLRSCSLTAGAATFRQVWRIWGWGSKVRLFNRKKNLWRKLESPCHIWCFVYLYQHVSSGRRKMAGERGQRKPIWSILFWNCKDTHQKHVFWEPEAVSSHWLATCSSSLSFSPVTSVAYMGPALEEFGIVFRYYHMWEWLPFLGLPQQ